MDDSYPTASRQMIRKPRNKSTIYTNRNDIKFVE